VLHVVQLSFFHDAQARRPRELLCAWPSLVDIAECAAAGGVRVSVIQASTHSDRIARNGITYYFLPFGRATVVGGVSEGLKSLLSELEPDLAHVQGLGFPRDVLSLARCMPRLPIVLQDHADQVPRLWHRSLWARGLAAASGVVFCAAAQAAPIVAAGLLKPTTRVYAVPESTSRFKPGDPLTVRRELNIEGDPVAVWVGHLDANKDPLTVLEGVSRAARHLPGLQLWCCSGTAPLLEVVTHRIQSDPVLRGRVQLLGRLPHQEVERVMQAADLFVLGSHREGSGYSLLEALACGVTPVVTDIPSFRALTGQGSFGELWPVGSPEGLCRALLAATRKLGTRTRAVVREYFDRELSFEAVGAKWAAAYADVAERAETGLRQPEPLALQ
jgi:glycosyltransferase involved in cell wall biosynthesis